MVISQNVINERDAASLIGCSVALLRKWRSYGGGPAYCKLGQRLVRYRREDIDAFLTSHRVVKGGDQI